MSTTLPSCLPKSALIELEDNSNPPILKYSLPESTAITAYSIEPLEMEIPASNFTNLAKKDYTPPAPVNPIAGPNPVWQLQSGVIVNRSPRVNEVKVSFATTPSVIENVFNTASKLSDATKANELVAVAAKNVEQGYAVVAESSFGGYAQNSTPIKRPIQISPGFFFVEELKVVSFLGNYGAGKTLETMTLLPGEKRKITIKTFKEITSLQSRAQNVIDSFSQASANELEDYVEKENSVNLKLDASVKTKATAKARIKIVDVEASAETSFSSSRTSNVRNLNKAMRKHVDSSNSSRQVEINTNTQNTSKESEETYLEREFENINKSRCLNFVFRQMLQEYITVTYLDDVKIAFNNGHPESYAEASLADLDKFLNDYIIDLNTKNAITSLIMSKYTSVRNNENQLKPFMQPNAEGKLVKFPYTNENPIPAGQEVVYVQGPILNVETHILKSAGVIGEALLGQGEALDCYNMRLQDLAYQEKYLKNQLMSKALDAADGLQGEEKARYLAQLTGSFYGQDAKIASGLDIISQAKNEGLNAEQRSGLFGNMFKETIIK